MKHSREAHEIFRLGETKVSRRKNMIPPFSSVKIFRNEKFSQKQQDSFTKIFGKVRQKNFDRKVWYPLLCKKLFDIPNFLEHLGKAHEVFPHCEMEIFWRKYVIASIMHRLFRLLQTFWNIEGMPTNFFGTVRPKIFHRKRDTPYYTSKLTIPQFF